MQTNVMLLMIAVVTALLLRQLLAYSHFGLDLTDEGYYLVWMANPSQYQWSVSQFGFVYHPIYQLLGGDIVRLRQFNVLITFLLACVLCIQVLKTIGPSAPSMKSHRFVLGAGLATTSWVVFDAWLVTPSYNSLALQSLLLTATGLTMAQKGRSPASFAGWAMICVGGSLAFLAKPSTALALTFAAVAYLFVARKISLRIVVLSVGATVTLMAAVALTIDSSMGAFFARIVSGIGMAGLLDAGHDFDHLFRIDRISFNRKEQAVALATLVFVPLGGLFAASQSRVRQWLALGLAIPVFIVACGLSLGVFLAESGLGHFQGVLLGAAGGSVLLWAVLERGRRVISGLSVEQRGLAALFLVMPYIFAFGTNTNTWASASSAGIFWVLSGVVLASRQLVAKGSLNGLIPLALLAVAMSALLLHTGFSKPYRQNSPLWTNRTDTLVGPSASNLRLSSSQSAFLRSMKRDAKKAGLSPGEPVLDLTGQSPGVLYALDAQNLGEPWIIGGYPGSTAKTAEILRRTPREKIRSAWLLVEPKGRRSIDLGVLQPYALEIDRCYTIAAKGTLVSVFRKKPLNRELELLKPVCN